MGRPSPNPGQPGSPPYSVLLMSLKRVMWFLLIGFGVFFLIESPGEAAKLVKMTGESAGEWLSTAADSLSTFVRSLV